MLQIHNVEAITLVESTLIDLFSLSLYRRCSFQSKSWDLTLLHNIHAIKVISKGTVSYQLMIDIKGLKIRNFL